MTIPSVLVDAAVTALIFTGVAAILTDTYAEFGYAALITLFIWYTVHHLGATVFTATLLLLMFAAVKQFGDLAELVGEQLAESDIDGQFAAVVVDALLSDDSSTGDGPDP